MPYYGFRNTKKLSKTYSTDSFDNNEGKQAFVMNINRNIFMFESFLTIFPPIAKISKFPKMVFETLKKLPETNSNDNLFYYEGK